MTTLNKKITKEELNDFKKGYEFGSEKIQNSSGLFLYDDCSCFENLNDKPVAFIAGLFSRIYTAEKNINLKEEVFSFMLERLANKSGNHDDFYNGACNKDCNLESEQFKKGKQFKKVFDSFFELFYTSF